LSDKDAALEAFRGEVAATLKDELVKVTGEVVKGWAGYKSIRTWCSHSSELWGKWSKTAGKTRVQYSCSVLGSRSVGE
jgi:hypothetical protein